MLSISLYATSSTDEYKIAYESFQKEDYVKAEEYYKKACDTGIFKACYNRFCAGYSACLVGNAQVVTGLSVPY